MRWFWGLIAAAILATLVVVFVGRGRSNGSNPAPTMSETKTATSPRTTPPPTTSSAKPEPVTAANADSTGGVAPAKAAPAESTAAAPETSVPGPSESASSATTNPPIANGDAVRPVPVETPAAGTTLKPTDPAASAGSAVPKPPPAASEPIATTPSEAPPAASDGAPKNRGWTQTGFVGPPKPEEVAAAKMQDDLNDALGITDTAAPPTPAAVSESAVEPKAAASAPAPAPAAGAKAKLEVRDDGSTLVDDRFAIRGEGTHEKPYEISWEMLVSAQETYQPRLGRKVIPDRLKMLDGKWVRIAGYIAFPLMAQSQDEMLMMLNQWDGCCIGVPPTPYDAIEVKLKAAAKGDDRLRVSGSVAGILRVDPYLVKDWLVSLYLMDDAELTVEGDKRAASPQQHQAPQ